LLFRFCWLKEIPKYNWKEISKRFRRFWCPCLPDSKTSKMSQKQTPQPLSVSCVSEDNVSEVKHLFLFHLATTSCQFIIRTGIVGRRFGGRGYENYKASITYDRDEESKKNNENREKWRTTKHVISSE